MGAEYDAHGGPVRDAPVHDVVPVYRDDAPDDAPVDVVQDDGEHGAPDGALYAPVCDDLLVKDKPKIRPKSPKNWHSVFFLRLILSLKLNF